MSVAVQALLDAGIADDTLRDDVPAQDVVAGMVGIVGVFLACGPDQRDQVGRLPDLLMDGLRRRGNRLHPECDCPVVGGHLQHIPVRAERVAGKAHPDPLLQ